MNKQINYHIQMLRGMAFLLIFFSHCTLIYDKNGGNLLNWWGAFGVELFIVLSGYLAFKYYPNDVSTKDYYKRKIIKFLPLHWITLLLSIPFCLPLTFKTFCKITINAMLFQDWIPKSSIYFSLNAVSWYLGITVFFILITPLIVDKLKSISVRSGIALISIIQILELLIAFTSNYISIDSHWITYICPLTRTLDFVGGGAHCI